MAENQRKINAIILDSDSESKKILKEYCSKTNLIKISSECDNAIDAINIINTECVNLVFTETHIGDYSGLEFAKILQEKHIMVIFVTNSSDYAVESYNLNTVDYLLKPLSFDRFMLTVSKILDRLNLLRFNEIVSANGGMDYLMIKADHKLYKIRYDDLMFVEGQSEYVTFHLNEKQNVTAYYSLKKLVRELPMNFLRIHKSYIVSLKYIDAVEGVMLAVAGRRLPIGKLYKEDLLARLYNKTITKNNLEEEQEQE